MAPGEESHPPRAAAPAARDEGLRHAVTAASRSARNPSATLMSSGVVTLPPRHSTLLSLPKFALVYLERVVDIGRGRVTPQTCQNF